MDINELLFQHQRAILHAGDLRPTLGPSSFDLVGHYAHRIRRLRERMGVVNYPEWMLLPPAAV